MSNPPKPLASRMDDIEAKMDELIALNKERIIPKEWMDLVLYGMSNPKIDPTFILGLCKSIYGNEDKD